MQNPRRIACLTLVRQEQNGYANLVLANALLKSDLPLRDKSFVSALFYGTIERCITLDAILAQYLSKPLFKLDAEVRAILRMGLYQAIYMNSVPVSAAINESVDLTRQIGKSSAAGFVNAVLRKASTSDVGMLTFNSDLHRLSILYSVSEPIAKIFVDTFGEDAEKELEATFERPRLCLRVNTLKITQELLKERLVNKAIPCTDGVVPNSLYVDFSGDITVLSEFKKGFFHVQGEASQYACLALSPSKGSIVLDLCAAPGGKSATLAQYMQNDGTLISADFAESRLSLVSSLLERNGVTCAKIVQGNAAEYNGDYNNADYVLCDVPCSGLGIISKKPDIRQKMLADLPQLIELQKDILNTASRYVKKGGRLVYSTCTINRNENEDIVNSFISTNKDFVIVPQQFGFSQEQKGNFAIFTPRNTKTDGFYVASLERLC